MYEMTNESPYILGHYSLIDHLGGWTFGVVFKAREQGSDTDQALKVLRPGISNIKLEEVERFRSEAKRHDALDNHVNIARFESLLTISCKQVSDTVLSLIDLSLPQFMGANYVVKPRWAERLTTREAAIPPLWCLRQWQCDDSLVI